MPATDFIISYGNIFLTHLNISAQAAILVSNPTPPPLPQLVAARIHIRISTK